jgi:branched-chain amino acid transport system permease protein
VSEVVDQVDQVDHTEMPALVPPKNYRSFQVSKVLVFTGVVSLAPLLVSSAYSYDLLNRWLIMSVVTIGFYVAFGLGGQFAFSQASFMAVGAYVSAKVSETQPVWLGFISAIVVCSVLGLIFAVAMRKASHFFFAIATLAFGELILVVASKWTAFAGISGQVLGVPRLSVFGKVFRTHTQIFYVLLAVVAVVLIITVLVERSPVRREAIANRDNPLVALMLGTPTLRLRIEVFTIGAAYAGAAGSLFAHTNGFVSIEAFGVDIGVQIFLMAVLGGLGSPWGAVAGAGFVIYVGEALRDSAQYKGLVFGAGLMLVMTVMPDGLVQGMVSYGRRGWRAVRGSKNRAPS